MKLSQRRAESVATYLVKNGVCQAVDSGPIARGKREPIASNATAEGRAQNRRVEIILFSRALTPPSRREPPAVLTYVDTAGVLPYLCSPNLPCAGSGIALGSVGLVYVVYLNQATLILLGISFVVAYLLDPSIDRLERLGLSRTLAISLLTSGCPGEHGRALSGRYSPVTAPGASCGWSCTPLGTVAL